MSVRCCIRFGGDKRRETDLFHAPETEGGRGSTQNPRPCHLRPCAMLLAPLPHGLQAVCSALRHPVSKGWGIFSYFYPYLLEASPVYNVLRYSFVKGMGIFRAFYPYLLDCTRPLLHSLSDFKISPSDHQAGLPYTTAPFSVRNGLASASRTERCRFSVPHVSASGPRTGEGSFLYRTENRLKVIEL